MRLRSTVRAGLIAAAVLMASLCFRLAAGAAEESPAFRVMTYNIHHGEGLDKRIDLQRIAAMIETEQADIVALQEVDNGVERSGRRDIASELAALAGMKSVFSNNFSFQGGEYGNAVLTRFPILSATNMHYKMLREGEPRGLLQVTLDIHGRKLLVMSTHIDHRADDAERWLNVQEIETLVNSISNMPVVICGDFNTAPETRVHERMSLLFRDAWVVCGKGAGFSFPALKPETRIDYIWFGKAAPLEPVSVRVPESEASDHRPVLAEFKFKGP